MAVLLVLCLMAAACPAGVSAREDPVFSSLDEVLSYVNYDCAYMLADEISFGYTAALDDLFATPDALTDIMRSAGLLNWSQYRNTDRRTVRIEDIQYYQGYKIAQAWEIEMVDYFLTDEEKRTLAAAQEMVDEAERYSQSPYQTALNLHDGLVRRVTYESKGGKEDWDSRDTAVGALLNGRAECDGYADAFYLLCTLAGIPVGFQYGQADGGLHQWNLIFFDGWWYHVDVTYDDLNRTDNREMCTYRYFCVGSEMMEKHEWNEEVVLHNQSPYNNWDYFFYTYHPTGVNGGAYYSTMQDAANYAVYMQQNYSHDSLHIMLDGRYEDAVRFNEVLLAAGLRGRWSTWHLQMGDYTCFDLMFTD